MTQLTVKTLSEEIGTPVDRLIEQLADAGIKKSSSDAISEARSNSFSAILKKNTAIRRVTQRLHALHYNVRLVAH
ncbi:translation initiation factor 2 [Vibrio ponticus]|nr:translation initiation factor 2 [Vibrio ponticus]